jgi:hypothetical protein
MEANTASPGKGIFDSANLEARDRVVELLRKAYWRASCSRRRSRPTSST